MSGADVTALLNTQYGNLSALLASKQSLWTNRGYDTTQIHAVDNTFYTSPQGNEANFGETVRFRIRKRGAQVHKTWLKVVTTAGVLAAGQEAAFVDDLGTALLQNVRLSYASKTLQEWNGEAIKAYRRLMYHDISREAYNAMTYAGLPPGVGGSEAQRQANVALALTLYIPLDFMYWCRFEDYSLVPEALASELELEVLYRPLNQVVYARVTATGLTSSAPFSTAPTIASSTLYQQLIFVPTPDKNNMLKTYETDQGQVFKILDIEQQVGNTVSSAAGTYKIKLDNFRLDSSFIVFYLRSVGIDTPFALDRMQSDTTPTILTGAGSVAALQSIQSFRLLANGRVIVDTVTDIENRAIHRDIYFNGTQIAEPIYFIPFGWLLKDAKNVTSFQNMSNLGNVELEITVGARGANSYLDAYNFCHNIVQWKRGDVIKALR